jgi:hypothetical protein
MHRIQRALLPYTCRLQIHHTHLTFRLQLYRVHKTDISFTSSLLFSVAVQNDRRMEATFKQREVELTAG